MRITNKLLALALLSSLNACTTNNLNDKFEQSMQNSSCAEMGSIECKVCKIIKADDNSDWYKFGDRKILFECRGTIKAGIDLSSRENITAEINESEKSIILTLPQAKILSLNLNPEDTKLVYEKVSMTRFDFNSVERTDLLKQGEAAIMEDFAKENELMKEAEKNCSSFFTSMLTNIGFKKITINYRKEAQNAK